MSNGNGVFAVDRGVFGHPLFADEPYTEREAWLWLVSQAAWKPHRVRVRNGSVDLQRGQLAYATRFMAEKWKWAEAKVRRFLKKLHRDGMINAQSDARTTIITVCNYAKFQRVALPAENATILPQDSDAQIDAHNRVENIEETGAGDAQIDAHVTRTRRKEENREYKEEDSNSSRASGSEPSWRIEFDMRFWGAYPHKVGRPKALQAFLAARQATELDVIMAGLHRYIREKPPDRDYLNPANFLAEERWNDEPAKRNDNHRKKPTSAEQAFASLGRIRSQMASGQHGSERGGGDGGSVVAIGPPGAPFERAG